jgi:ketosteroid isomerase-like protein
MQARIRWGAWVLGCGVALSGVAFAAEPKSAGDCFLAGNKSNNADTVAACYAEDAILWFPGGPMAKGRTAIRDGFAGYMASMTIKDATLNQMGEAAMGDTRTTWGTYAMTLVDKASGKETVEHGRYVDVQKKIDGRWQYIVDHPSDEPAPVAASPAAK